MSCPCDDIEHARIVGDLLDTECLELIDRAQWARHPRWGHCLVRCRDRELVLEAAGYDYMGKDVWEFRVAKEGLERFLELASERAIEASRLFVEMETQRLSGT